MDVDDNTYEGKYTTQYKRELRISSSHSNNMLTKSQLSPIRNQNTLMSIHKPVTLAKRLGNGDAMGENTDNFLKTYSGIYCVINMYRPDYG